MKKILIGGCSFSESYLKRKGEVTDHPWIPYTDLLENHYKDFEVTNTARDSAGNSEISENIVEQVIKNDYDFVIVQWSAMGRGSAKTEAEWIEKLINSKSLDRLHRESEYLNTGLDEGQTSNGDWAGHVSSNHYRTSLLKIKMTQAVLENKNVPYVFFWGWRQLNDYLYQKNKKLVDSIYEANWWYPNDKLDGMKQYVCSILSEEGLADDGLHPSSKGHKLFFENIIKPIFDDK
jgi:hypothetical protein